MYKNKIGLFITSAITLLHMVVLLRLIVYLWNWVESRLSLASFIDKKNCMNEWTELHTLNHWHPHSVTHAFSHNSLHIDLPHSSHSTAAL